MSERDDKPRRSDLSDDLEDFDRRLSEKLAQHRGPAPQEAEKSSAWSTGLRYGSGFAGGVLVGTGLGWLIDRSFDSAPLGILIGLFLGFAAGIRNIMRDAAALSSDADAGDEPGADTEDD